MKTRMRVPLTVTVEFIPEAHWEQWLEDPSKPPPKVLVVDSEVVDEKPKSKGKGPSAVLVQG